MPVAALLTIEVLLVHNLAVTHHDEGVGLARLQVLSNRHRLAAHAFERQATQ